MGIKFNPLGLSGFDLTGGASGPSGYAGWKAPVESFGDLPLVGNTDGDVRVTYENAFIYVWNEDQNAWIEVATSAEPQTLANKTIDADSNLISNIENNEIKSGAAIDVTKLANGSVNNTEFQYLDGVTSPIQTQLDGKASTSLNNLASTAINAALIFGSSVVGIFKTRDEASTVSTALTVQTGDTTGGGNSGNLTLKSGSTDGVNNSGGVTLQSGDYTGAGSGTSGPLTIRTGSGVSSTTGSLTIATGSASTGDSGNITIQSGTTSGTRGAISLDGRQVNVNNTKIINVTDPTSAQDAATKNYIDTTFVPLSQKGAALGVATLDGGGKVPVTQLPSAIMTYEGVWNASTNSPTLADGTGDTGQVYRVSVAGTQNLGSGSITFDVGDYVIYNNSGVWEKSDTTDSVVSVNSLTGIVSLTTTNIPEGTNLYHTDERAQDAVGTILLDSTSIDFTYNDGVPSITASVVVDNSTLEIAGGNVRVKDAGVTDAKIATNIDAAKLANGTVSNTEFQYLDGVTSSIQTQLNSKATTELDNLGATAINADLLVDTPDTYDLGANGSAWQTVYANNLQKVNAGITVDLTSGNLKDAAGSISVDWDNYQLSENGTTKLSWGGTDIDLGGRKIINVNDPTAAQDAATKAYVDSVINFSTGDIQETSFTIANNQVAAANVTGLAFAGTIRSAKIQYSITIDATTDLYESGELKVIQKNGTWDIAQDWAFDNSLVLFSVTNAGQVQYTSASYAGYVSGKMQFRAWVTTV